MSHVYVCVTITGIYYIYALIFMDMSKCIIVTLISRYREGVFINPPSNENE